MQPQEIDLLNMETTDDLMESPDGDYVAPDLFGNLDTEIKLDDHAGLINNFQEESKSNNVNDPELG